MNSHYLSTGQRFWPGESRKKVVFAFLGTERDHVHEGLKITDEKRWEYRRPTISVCQVDGFPVSRLILLRGDDPAHVALAEEVKAEIALVSKHTSVEIVDLTFDNKRDAWDIVTVYDKLVAFLSNFLFDRKKEEYFFHAATGTHIMKMCTLLLIESNHFPGKLVQSFSVTEEQYKFDAYGRLRYTIDIVDLEEARYDRALARSKTLVSPADILKSGGITTKNEALQKLYDELELVSLNSRAPILLTGPSGCGKTRLAHLIYECKKKNQALAELISVNCAALSSEEAKDVLFGQRSNGKARGLLKQAQGGLLFLDNIDALCPSVQAMLLDILDSMPRSNSSGVKKSQTADRLELQLICASAQDLWKMARQGHFRSDLLARISHWSYQLPGLTERPEDLENCLDEAVEKHRGRISKEARELLLEKARRPEALWKNNLLDLDQLVERMILLSKDGVISRSIVEQQWRRQLCRWHQGPSSGSRDAEDRALLADIMGDRAYEISLFELPQLARAITACRNAQNMAAAGRLLFETPGGKKINYSDRMKKYLALFGLTWQDVRFHEGSHSKD